MADQLKSKMISGGRWLFLNQAINQPIRIIVGILLTRLLLPEDFGLVAKSFAVTGIAELVLVQGLLGAVIQDKDIEKRQVHTLFWISFLWSVFIATTIFFLAPTIAQFYGDDKVAWIVRVASISIVFAGMQLVPSALIRKNLQFKKIFIAATSSGIISSAVAIYFTLEGYGYKALIFQFVINSILNGLIIFKISNWLPKFKFNLKEVSSHIKFGLNVTGANILNYLVRNADDVALGKFQSNATLGQYARAYFLMLTPLNIVDQIFNTLLFPTFSKIQNDKERVSYIFFKAQEIILLLTFPFLTFFFFNVEIIVNNLLGLQWASTIVLFKIFTPLLLIQLFTSPISSIYMTYNKTKYLFKFSLITKPILIISIILAANYGQIEVAIIITILSSIFGSILYKNGVNIISNHSIKQSVNHFKLFLICWLFQGALQLIVTYGMNNINIRFVLSIVILGLFYIIYFYIKPNMVKEFRKIINS